MSRKSGDRQFEVRVKEKGRIRSVFVPAKDNRRAAEKVHGGNVISVKKIPLEKIFSVGEFSPFFHLDPEVFGFDRSIFLPKKEKDRAKKRVKDREFKR